MGVRSQVDDLPDLGVAFLRQLGEVLGGAPGDVIGVKIRASSGMNIGAPPIPVLLGVVDQDLQRSAWAHASFSVSWRVFCTADTAARVPVAGSTSRTIGVAA